MDQFVNAVTKDYLAGKVAYNAAMSMLMTTKERRYFGKSVAHADLSRSEPVLQVMYMQLDEVSDWEIKELVAGAKYFNVAGEIRKARHFGIPPKDCKMIWGPHSHIMEVPMDNCAIEHVREFLKEDLLETYFDLNY